MNGPDVSGEAPSGAQTESSKTYLHPKAPTAEQAAHAVAQMRNGNGTLPFAVTNVDADVVLQMGLNPRTSLVLTQAGAERLGMMLLAASGRWVNVNQDAPLRGDFRAAPEARPAGGEWGTETFTHAVDTASPSCFRCKLPIDDDVYYGFVDPDDVGTSIGIFWHQACDDGSIDNGHEPAPVIAGQDMEGGADLSGRSPASPAKHGVRSGEGEV